MAPFFSSGISECLFSPATTSLKACSRRFVFGMFLTLSAKLSKSLKMTLASGLSSFDMRARSPEPPNRSTIVVHSGYSFRTSL